jgi:hypothetical protein
MDKMNGKQLTVTVGVLVFLLFIILSMAPALDAQIVTGTIEGMVKDQSGATIPGAKVDLINEGTGARLEMTTGPSGYYVFPRLKVGRYTIEAEAKGFARVVHSGLSLNIQQVVVVNVTLVPGKVTQTIVVKTATPILQTQDASVGQVVGARLINDLPLNGRDFTELALIVTGTSNTAPDSSLDRPFFTSSGHPMVQNDYRLNGIDNNNEEHINPEPYMVAPPPDALEEFNLQTNNYSAEFGHSAGAILNAVTKSGTNSIHGDLWEFLRNDTFDAAQFFQNAAGETKAPYHQNQLGGTLGGPVVIPHVYNGKDKTFFFVDAQITRIHEADVSVDSVPSTTEVASGFTNMQDLITDQSGTRTDALGRTLPLGTVFNPATTRLVTAGQVDPVTGLTATTTGYVRDPFYEGSLVGVTNFTSAAQEAKLNILPADRLDPNAIKLLSLYPAAQSSGIISNYTYPASLINDTNSFDFRFDQNISTRDQLAVTGDWYERYGVQPGAYPGIAGDAATYPNSIQDRHGMTYMVSETHSFSPTLMNEVRLGWGNSPFSYLSPYGNMKGIPAQYGIQGIPQTADNGGLPPISIGGLTGMGEGGYLPVIETSSNWDLMDNVTKVHGAHTIEAGFQGSYIMGYSLDAPYSRGAFCYSGAYTEVPNTSGGSTGLAQLLLAPVLSTVPDGIDDVGGPDSVRASSMGYQNPVRTYLGAYFQDDWKVARKLTLNLGLRWDRFGAYADRFGAQGNFVPGADGSEAQYLIPERSCHTPVSASFVTLTQQDGISVQCSDNPGLGTVQNGLFSPRLGLAYMVTPKLVVRAGYGLFYGDMGSSEEGQTELGNYPFVYQLSYSAPDPGHPVTFPDGSSATYETGLSQVDLSPSAVNAQYLSLTGVQWNHEAPYFSDYNFMVQYALTPQDSIQLGYVGNVSRHGTTNSAANLPSQILPPGLDVYDYVPYPDFAEGSSYYTYNGNSYYNSLQATFQRTFKDGLTFNANYTYSKCRGDVRNSFNSIGGFRAADLPGFGIQGDYSLCMDDIPNLMHLSGLYQLPVGNGRRFLGNSHGVLNQVLGGWETNWILTEMDGLPFNIGCPISTTTGFGCFALLVPGHNIYAGSHDVNDWLNPAAFANPPVATSIGESNYAPLGGAPTQALGPGLHRLDFSIFKEFPISESKRFEFRTEIFNLTNTPWFANPSYTDFTDTATFGRITSLEDGLNDPREIQFALKFYW